MSDVLVFKLILKSLQIGLASLIAISSSSSISVDAINNPKLIPGKIVVEVQTSIDKNYSRDSQNQTKPTITMAEIIREVSEKYGVDDNLAVEIARCESNLKQYNSENGRLVRGKVNSKDVGVFQINEDYHLRQSQKQGYDIYTTRGNIEYAIWLIKKSGSQPWSASKPCWNHITMK